MGKALIKKVWNHIPPGLRGACLGGLLSFKFRGLERKPRSGPLYVAGAFLSASGMGMGARLYAKEARAAGRACYCVDLTREMRMAPELCSAGNLLGAKDLERMEGGVLVLHANPPQYQLALAALPSAFLKTVHIRAYWAWELEELPAVWRGAAAFADSVECPSHFCRKAIARHASVPAAVHAHAVEIPARRKESFCRGGVLRCLSVFDAGSSFERKNPFAALSAFRKAFKEGEAELLFKISHAGSDIKAYRKFREECAKTPGVGIIEETLGDDELAELYLANDVYISLHRSEGFGLTIKEAINFGLRAVATGWSGNMDFMKGGLCHPVPFSLKPVRWRSGPMAGLEARWAEADTDAAALILRKLRKELARGGAV